MLRIFLAFVLAWTSAPAQASMEADIHFAISRSRSGQTLIQETLPTIDLCTHLFLPEVFTQVPSQNLTQAPLQNLTQSPKMLPTEVTSSAQTVASVASVTSIVVLSPSSVTQASRLATTQNLLACQTDSSFEAEPLGWAESPTQLDLGNTSLRYVKGGLLGNWAILAGLTISHTAGAKAFGAGRLRYPGLSMPHILFFSSPIAKGSTLMIRFGTPAEQTYGAFSFLGQAAIIGGTLRFLTPSKFGAEWVKVPDPRLTAIGENAARWLPKPGKSESYMKRFGLWFKDYREGRQWYLSPEILMAVGAGTLDAFQVDPQTSCESLLYVASGTYGLYTASLLILYPHKEIYDRIYFGGAAALQTTTLTLGAMQKSIPSLQNNTALSTTIEVAPVILQYVTLLRTTFDVTMSVYSLYKFYCRVRPSLASINVGSTGPAPTNPLLAVPLLHNDPDL